MLDFYVLSDFADVVFFPFLTKRKFPYITIITLKVLISRSLEEVPTRPREELEGRPGRPGTTRKRYFFIWFSCRAFSFPMKK